MIGCESVMVLVRPAKAGVVADSNAKANRKRIMDFPLPILAESGHDQSLVGGESPPDPRHFRVAARHGAHKFSFDVGR